jgi:hypothetical protein
LGATSSRIVAEYFDGEGPKLRCQHGCVLPHELAHGLSAS